MVVAVADEYDIRRRDSWFRRPFGVTARDVHKNNREIFSVPAEPPKYPIGVDVAAANNVFLGTHGASYSFATASATSVVNDYVANLFRPRFQTGGEIVESCLFIFPANSAVFVKDTVPFKWMLSIVRDGTTKHR
jgi:hypothetical protein